MAAFGLGNASAEQLLGKPAEQRRLPRACLRGDDEGAFLAGGKPALHRVVDAGDLAFVTLELNGPGGPAFLIKFGEVLDPAQILDHAQCRLAGPVRHLPGFHALPREQGADVLGREQVLVALECLLALGTAADAKIGGIALRVAGE